MVCGVANPSPPYDKLPDHIGHIRVVTSGECHAHSLLLIIKTTILTHQRHILTQNPKLDD